MLVPLHEIGARLYKTRMNRGVSIRKAASEIGIQFSAVYRYEQGTSQVVNMSTWLAVSEWINCNLPDKSELKPTDGKSLLGIEKALKADKVLTSEQRHALMAMMSSSYVTYLKLQQNI